MEKCYCPVCSVEIEYNVDCSFNECPNCGWVFFENQFHYLDSSPTLKEARKAYKDGVKYVNRTYRCPVCTKEIYDDSNNCVAVCPRCSWNFNGYQLHYPDSRSWHNRLTLNEARKVYKALRENPNEVYCCPVCYNAVWDNPNGSFAQCPYCGWIFDSLQLNCPNKEGANSMTLNESRKAYLNGRKNVNKSYQCPVCNNEVEDDPDNSFEECPHCGWGFDGTQLRHPDWGGCFNKMSLNEARQAFKEGKEIH